MRWIKVDTQKVETNDWLKFKNFPVQDVEKMKSLGYRKIVEKKFDYNPIFYSLKGTMIVLYDNEYTQMYETILLPVSVIKNNLSRYIASTRKDLERKAININGNFFSISRDMDSLSSLIMMDNINFKSINGYVVLSNYDINNAISVLQEKREKLFSTEAKYVSLINSLDDSQALFELYNSISWE